MVGVLQNLRPERVWYYFEEISQIPRCSENMEGITGYLLRFAREHCLEHRRDSASNILVKKPALPGLENAPVIVLQSHLDMVCEKHSGSRHDFARQPVKLKVKAGSVMAEGTTLGGDNGLGIAAMLAILEQRSIPTGTLECLFTVDEEIGLKGAFALDTSLLSGRLLINLDSEEVFSIYIGCAGGRDSKMTLPIRRRALAQDECNLKLNIRGLRGGHSGAEIHLGRANAIKILARILYHLKSQLPLRVVSFSGGDKLNAIPREATALIAVPEKDVGRVHELFDTYCLALKKEYHAIETEINISIQDESHTDTPLDTGSSETFINFLSAIPHGVIAMSPVIEGLVETSTNLASVHTSTEAVHFTSSHRSSVDSALNWVCDLHSAIAAMAGAEIQQNEGYPGWSPDESSRLLAYAKKAVKKVSGEEARVTAIHAGLECGVIKRKYEGMDAISIGPTIRGAHSPQEKVEIESVETFWKILLQLLKEIYTKG